MNTYEARWRNAKRIAERIIDLQNKGWLIFNNQNEIVGKVQITEEQWGEVSIVENCDHCRDYWFMNDKHYDEGLYTPIKQFNTKFKDWKCVDPKNIVPLTLE